jgi:hypothetical protein
MDTFPSSPEAATAGEALDLVRDDPALLDAPGVWTPWTVAGPMTPAATPSV